jgi:hypothetical protein
MLRVSASLLFLLAGSFTLAQTPSDPPAAPKDSQAKISQAQIILGLETRRLSSNHGCPVGFAANRQAPVQMMSADDARRLGPMQGLHLTLRKLKDMAAIESIEVTVYGTSQKGLVLPVGTQSTDTVSKTFQLRRTSDDTSLSEADVSMQLVGSLRWADLVSITYADGDTWHATTELRCRAVPSNFLLVGAK